MAFQELRWEGDRLAEVHVGRLSVVFDGDWVRIDEHEGVIVRTLAEESVDGWTPETGASLPPAPAPLYANAWFPSEARERLAEMAETDRENGPECKGCQPFCDNCPEPDGEAA